MKSNVISGFSTMASSIEYADNYNNWIYNSIKGFIGKNILEVGTGQGTMKNNFGDCYETYVSIDIDEDIILRAQKRDKNGIYLQVDISNKNSISKIESYDFDTILCFNVLEHIKDDYNSILNLNNVLKKGGQIVLLLPAFMCLYNDMDKLAGHYRRYTRKTIIKLFSKTDGIRIERIEYFNPLGALGWWVNKFFKHKDIDSKNINRQVIFFDNYIVPISKILNNLTKTFIGQSLIVVLKKIE